MKIRSKIILPLSLILLAAFGTLEFTVSSFMLQRFASIEANHMADHSRRAERGFRDEIDKLVAKLVEWVQWDEANAFAQGKNPGFIASNLQPVVLDNSDFDFMLFLDAQRRLIYSLSRDTPPNQLPPMLRPVFERVSRQLPGLLQASEMLSGYVLIEQVPYLVAGGAIVNSAGQGPGVGYVILGRRFDQRRILGLATRSELRLAFTPLASGEAAPPSATPLIQVRDEHHIDASTVLSDLEGRGLLRLTVSQPRPVHVQALESLTYIRIILSLAAALSLASTWLLLRITVIKPLELQAQELAFIREQKQARLSQVGLDEIGDISREFNHQLDALADNEQVRNRQDIELRENARRLAEQNLSLNEATRLAEQANKAKSEFLSVLSHELLTPLNQINAMAYLLANSRLDEQQCEQIKQLRQSGQALHKLLANILDYTRLEAGKAVARQQAFSLENLLAELRVQYSAKAGAKLLSLVCKEELTHHLLLGDPGRLRQILEQLLDNAVKFTSQGGVTLESRMEVDASHCQLDIAVHDTGPGIPPAQLKTLFTAFAQGDSSANRRNEGAGIGLALTSKLCELLQATLTVESQPGMGSTFRLKLVLPLAN